MHTCPATCLHHRARAGCDSVCQCLQWSDYAPVLRHVQSSSVCSLSSAAVYICLPGRGCGDDTSAWVGTTETQAASVCRHVNSLNGCQGTFYVSSYSTTRYVSCAAAVIVFCSSVRRGREEKEKKTLRTADSVLHAILKGPSDKRREEKREGKGCGGLQKRGKNSLTHYLWRENHPRAERHLGYRCRLLFSVGSFPHTLRRWGRPLPALACCRRYL